MNNGRVLTVTDSSAEAWYYMNNYRGCEAVELPTAPQVFSSVVTPAVGFSRHEDVSEKARCEITRQDSDPLVMTLWRKWQPTPDVLVFRGESRLRAVRDFTVPV